MNLLKPIATYSLAFFLLVLASCKKEYSVENTNAVVGEGTAIGILGGDGADCSNTEVFGAYGVGLATDTSDQVVIEMNVTGAGTYRVSSDTVNGVYFTTTGSATSIGLNSIVLQANGTPVTAGSFVYTVQFKGSICSFELEVFQVAPDNGTSNYFPLTTNSFWKYVSSDPSADPEDTLRNISTGKNFTVAGVTYNLFESNTSFGTDSSFYRTLSGEYHQFGDLDLAGAASNYVLSDFIFLKDNVAVGTSWESPEGDALIDTATVKIKLKFTITEKDVKAAIGNVVFKNVIKVTTSEMVKLPAGYSTILTYETWYARGIGMINIAAAAPLYGYQIQQYQVF